MADALTGDVEKQAVNIPAIVMFFIFVAGTLYITYWAAKQTNPPKISIRQVAAFLVLKWLGDCR